VKTVPVSGNSSGRWCGRFVFPRPFCGLLVVAMANVLPTAGAERPASSSAEATMGRQVLGNGDILINEIDKHVERDLLQKTPLQTNLWKPVPYTSCIVGGMI
jgi:hypothetical protein